MAALPVGYHPLARQPRRLVIRTGARRAVVVGCGASLTGVPPALHAHVATSASIARADVHFDIDLFLADPISDQRKDEGLAFRDTERERERASRHLPSMLAEQSLCTRRMISTSLQNKSMKSAAGYARQVVDQMIPTAISITTDDKDLVAFTSPHPSSILTKTNTGWGLVLLCVVVHAI
jgi:hypothetical protein